MYYGPERKRNRLENYDYSRAGYYFVTICIKGRIPYFGEILNSEMILNKYGEIAKTCWGNIENHYENISVDEFVIMPNHVHGILSVGNDYYRSENREDDVLKNEQVEIDIGSGIRENEYLKNDVGSRDENIRPLRRGNISNAIKGFKIGVTKEIRQNFGDYEFAWQRSFHDRIIRNEDALLKARKYIQENPARWEEDVNNIFEK